MGRSSRRFAPVAFPPRSARNVVGTNAIESIMSSAFVAARVRGKLHAKDGRVLEAERVSTVVR